MKKRINIEEARTQTHALLTNLLQIDPPPENIEEERDVIDQVFLYCRQALDRKAKTVDFPKILAQAKQKIRREPETKTEET